MRQDEEDHRAPAGKRYQPEEEDTMQTNKHVFASACVVALGVGAAVVSAGDMGKIFGVPTEGMSVEEYQSLVFLDPQNTVRMD